MAHRVEQRGPYPVDLGQRPGRGGRLLETLLPKGDGCLGGKGLQDPPVLGCERMPRHDQGVGVVDVHLGIAVAWCQTYRAADARDHSPRLVRMFQIRSGERLGSPLEESYSVECERLTDLLEQRRQRAVAA